MNLIAMDRIYREAQAYRLVTEDNMNSVYNDHSLMWLFENEMNCMNQQFRAENKID